MKNAASYIIVTLVVLFGVISCKGDDIVMSRGKLIMKGGNGKGNLILDTSQRNNEHMMHMIPMMGHHFDPFSFYPMHDHHSQHNHMPAPMMIHPVYVEDHSAMHHKPEKHADYHEGEPHYEHQEHHEYHQEMEHEPHDDAYHHEQPQHHESMGYEHDSHHGQMEHHIGGMHPMMSMMMHGSGIHPAYQQLGAISELQQATQLESPKRGQQQTNSTKQDNSSLVKSTNPFAALIKPLFKRHNDKQKKPNK